MCSLHVLLLPPLLCISGRPRGALWQREAGPVDMPVVWGWVPWCTTPEGTGRWGEGLPLRGGTCQGHGWPAQTQVSDTSLSSWEFSFFFLFSLTACLPWIQYRQLNPAYIHCSCASVVKRSSVFLCFCTTCLRPAGGHSQPNIVEASTRLPCGRSLEEGERLKKREGKIPLQHGG